MAHRLMRTFLDTSGNNESNILETAGAFLLLIAPALPWFAGHYAVTDVKLSALKILYDAMHSKADYSFYTIFVLLYLPALALYVLISRKTKKGSMLAFTGIVLLGIFIFRFPASADNIAVGVYAAFAGLAAITAAVLKKQR